MRVKAAPGTASGGNLIVANTPVLTTGAGGRATLYSGSISDTTLATLIGIGSGRFRYNSDELSTRYTVPLGAGSYGIYREQPTVTLSAADQTIVYGSRPAVLPGVASGALVNGDDLASVTAGMPSSAVVVYNAANTSPAALNSTGYYDVTGSPYTLRIINPTFNALGYGYISTPSSLTITPKPLTVTANNDSKFFSRPDPTNYPNYQGVSVEGLAAGETPANLGGTLQITRSGLTGDGAGDAAGNYDLTPVGLNSSNYTFTYNKGTFTIVPADKLRIVVNNLSNNQYGQARNYAVSSVSYLDSEDSEIYKLAYSANTGNQYTFVDPRNANSPVNFTVTEASPILNGAYLTPNRYSLDAINVDTHSSSNFIATVQLSGSVVVNPKLLTLTGVKSYDGTTALTSGQLTLGGLAGTETLTATNIIASDGHVATVNKYISDITLADGTNGGTAAYYQLPNLIYQPGVNSVTITPANLQASLSNTGITKVYDGTTAAPGNGNGSFDPNWTATGLVGPDSHAAFTYTAAAYDTAGVTASNLTLSGVALAEITAGYGLASDYLLDASTEQLAASITPRPVQVGNATAGLTKIYDGNTSLQGGAINLVALDGNPNSGIVAGDNLTGSSASGSFSSADAGTGKAYTLTGLQLNGPVAGNYVIAGASGAEVSGNDGVIYQRPLAITFTGINKVYDANTSATVTVSYPNPAYAPVAGDDVAPQATTAFLDKNVAAGKTVAISGVSLSGANLDNYTLTYDPQNPLHSPTVGTNAGYNATATAAITRLNSVTWIGRNTGNWFDPANWEGGAVPDLANVANVILPTDVVVDFGAAVVAPAEAGAVQIDSLGPTGASLNMTAGQLDVGTGGINLTSLSQTGGALSSNGAVVLNNFSQSAGTVTINNNFTVSQSYAQMGNGSVAVTGTVTINDTTGGVTLGNLSSQGALSVVSGGGDITQHPGTSLTTLSTSTFNAGNADVILAKAGNNFVGPVTITANDVSLQDGTGGIVLGTVSATGNLAVTSTNGNISQSAGSTVTAPGSTTLDAGTFDILLGNNGNNFVGPVTLIADDVTIKDSTGGIVLANVDTTGALGITSTAGNITQAAGTTIQANGGSLNAGINNVTLTNNGNDFTGPLSITAGTATVKDDIGGIALGTVTTTGALTITSTNGNISQAPGGTIAATGTTTLNASTFDILLGNNGNNFVGPVTLTADDASLKDSTGGIVLANVTTTGTLDIGSTGGNITQTAGSTIQSGGSTALNAGSNNVTLVNNGNNFVGPVGITAVNASLKDDNGGLILGDVNTSGLLSLTSTAGDITQANSTTLQSGGSTTLNAGNNDITLSNAGNNFVGPVTLSANDASLKDDNGGIVLDTVTTTGNLGVTSTNGNISQSVGGILTVAGTTTLDAGSFDILLNNTSNNFVGPVALSADDVTITDSTGGLVLATVDITGNLGITSVAGDITQAAGSTVKVDGSSNLNAGANDVVLTNNGNDFVGPISIIANDAILKDDTGGIVVGNITTTGNLGINSTAGDITQTAGSTVQSNGTTTLNAGTNDVLLGNDGNNFVGTVTVTANDALLKDHTGGIVLGNVTTTGNLGITSTAGDITQAAGSTVQSAGTTTLNAGTNDVLLGNDGNNFVGTVTVTANDALLKDDTGGIVLGNITTTGNLGITSTAGDITQTAGSTVQSTGPTNLNAGTNDVLLGNDGNNFVGTVTVTANNALLKDDTGGIVLGNVTTTGNLGINSTVGDITQAVGTSVQSSGATNLNAGTNDVLLGNDGNNFVGAVTVTANDALLKDDTGGIVLGNITTTGNLGITSTAGDITQAPGSTVQSNGTTNLNAGTNDVLLGNDGNNFVGAVTVTANDAVLKDDTGGIVLGNITTTGNLGINSTAGDIIQAAGTAVQSTGTTTLNAGTNDVLLGNDGNNFVGAVTVAANDATLKDDIGGIVLGNVTTTGNLGITSTAGDITQAPGSTVQSNGTTNLNAGTNDLVLGNDGNNFVGAVNVAANDAVLKDDTGGIVLGNLTTTGNLGINSMAGDITQTPGSTVQSNGTTNLNAGTNDVLLGNDGNNFVGTVTVTAKDATLKDDTGGIVLGNVTTTGNLGITSTAGDITQAPGSTVQSNGTTNLNAGTNDVLLGNDNNNFVGAVAVTANDATLKDDTGGIILGNVTTSGNLDITSTAGDITQTPDTFIQTMGTTSLNAGSNDVNLTNNGNNFVGSVSVLANNANLKDDTGGVILATVKTSGNLELQSTNGDITQIGSSSVQINGTSNFSALNGTDKPANIFLNNIDNSFGGSISLAGGNLTVENGGGGVVLNNVNSTGGLNVNSKGGNITQTKGGQIKDKGTTSLSAGNGNLSGDINLSNPGNDFTKVNAVGNKVTLADFNGFIKGTVNANQFVDLSPNGNGNGNGGGNNGGNGNPDSVQIDNVLSSVLTSQFAARPFSLEPHHADNIVVGQGAPMIIARQDQDLIKVLTPVADSQFSALNLDNEIVHVEFSQHLDTTTLTLPELTRVNRIGTMDDRKAVTIPLSIDGTSAGAFTIVDDGIYLSLKPTAATEEATLPVNAGNSSVKGRSTQSTVSLTDGRQVSITVGLSSGNALLIQMPKTFNLKPADQPCLVLLSVLVAKQDLHTAIGDITAIALN